MAYAGKTGERAPATVRRINPPATTGPLITGLAIGLLVGAGVALLFAPERGSDTRRVLRRRMRHASARGRDAWEDLKLELKRARRQLRRARMRKAMEEPEPEES